MARHVCCVPLLDEGSAQGAGGPVHLGKRAEDLYFLFLPAHKGREVPQGPRIAFKTTPRSPRVSSRLSILPHWRVFPEAQPWPGQPDT